MVYALLVCILSVCYGRFEPDEPRGCSRYGGHHEGAMHIIMDSRYGEKLPIADYPRPWGEIVGYFRGQGDPPMWLQMLGEASN